MKGPDGVVSGVYDPSSNTPGHVVFDKKQDRDPHGSGKVHESTPKSDRRTAQDKATGCYDRFSGLFLKQKTNSRAILAFILAERICIYMSAGRLFVDDITHDLELIWKAV